MRRIAALASSTTPAAVQHAASVVLCQELGQCQQGIPSEILRIVGVQGQTVLEWSNGCKSVAAEQVRQSQHKVAERKAPI
jgi:hypothetical protein